MRSRIRTDAGTQDGQTVTRVRTALEGYAAEGGPGASVSVAHVLDLLDPRGMWSFDPEHAARDTPPQGVRDPNRDPLTGAMWAGAPGTTPPQ
jgi:hypothetical protein